MNINDDAFASRGEASSKLDIARNVSGKAKGEFIRRCAEPKNANA